jgi:uncharacterized protein YegP (UPF0339 family)
MTTPSIEFYCNKAGKWSWRLRAANNRIICTPGEDFCSRRNAMNNFADVVGVINNPATRRENREAKK